jgi:hypothetical protein
MKLRFTIRDLFWLVLVAALAGGWYYDKSRTNARLNLLEDQYETEHAFSIDDRNRLVNGLKVIGPESIDICSAENNGYSWNCGRQLVWLFTDAGWKVSHEKSNVGAPGHGVRLYFPSAPPQAREKGLAIANLLLMCCDISVRPVETDSPKFRIIAGETFFEP